MDVILNAILIPRLAATGAAIGTLVAEFAVLLVQYVALRKDVTPALKNISYWKILLALIAACAVCIWVKFMDFSYFISLLISAVLFFAVYILLLYLLKESFTRETIVQIFDRFRKIIKKA